jgi:hypothetical protein
MKNIAILLSACLLPVFAGCASEALDPADQEEAEATESDLSANAQRLVGVYRGSATSAGIENLVLKADGTFIATGDTGVRCVRAPCPSTFRIGGRFSATKNYLRLNGSSADLGNGFFGRYAHKLIGGKLALSSTGRSSALNKEVSFCEAAVDCEGQGLSVPRCMTAGGGLTCSATNACGYSCGSNPIPANASKISASSGGGFVRPGPAGSCALGASFSLDMKSRTLTWKMCNYAESGPYQSVTGTRTISHSELGTFERAAAEVKTSTSTICGADKPFKTIDVVSRSGSTTLTDAFYSCNGPGNYVDNIEAVLSAFETLANKP